MSKIQYLDDASLKSRFPAGVSNDDTVIIDVRAPLEAMVERIACSINLPLDEMPLCDKSKFAGKTLVFHCKGGVRTRNNQTLLEQFDSSESYCMDGGIEQWKNCGFKVVK